VRSKSGCDRDQVITWTFQLHVDFADCKASLSHHGRQISESESEAQGTATGESQQRGSEETAKGLSRQRGAEKEVDDAPKQQPWLVRRLPPGWLTKHDSSFYRHASVFAKALTAVPWDHPLLTRGGNRADDIGSDKLRTPLRTRVCRLLIRESRNGKSVFEH
jgi:hypothetical protein